MSNQAWDDGYYGNSQGRGSFYYCGKGAFSPEYLNWNAGQQQRAADDAAAARASSYSSYSSASSYSSPSYSPGSYSSGSYSGVDYDSGIDGSRVWSGIKGTFGVIVLLVILGVIFGSGDKKSNTSTASASSTASSVSIPFAQGAADRQAWESWFNSLSGDYRAGADHWAAVRNTSYPGSCLSGQTQTSDAYGRGCLNAKQFFDSKRVDTRRKTEAEYRRGWNSI